MENVGSLPVSVFPYSTTCLYVFNKVLPNFNDAVTFLREGGIVFLALIGHPLLLVD